MANEIHVLGAFTPFLRLLQAYNADDFHRNNPTQIRHNIYYALGTTVIIVFVPVYGLLTLWDALASGAGNFMKKAVTAVPLLLTGLQVEFTYIALMMRNRSIRETIDGLQNLISRRE